jgi:thiamine thiazole synthase
MFEKISEKDITKAILKGFARDFEEYAESDVIIIGAGPAGLMAGKYLAQKKLKTLIIERNNYLGGGFWIGGFLMNKVTFRAPSQSILEELSIPFTEYNKGLFVADGPHACSKLIAAACETGVMILNMARFEDVVIREENRIGGVVINWTPVSSLPREITCVDPVGLEAKIVIDASGHDAVVVRKLEERGIIKIPGYGAMWVEKSEDAIIEHTGEVFPGLAVCGMSVSTTYGLPRMGPTFGAMLLSGEKVGKVMYEKIKS